MEIKDNTESSMGIDSADNVKLEAAKPVGGIRETKKVTLEIDIEKTLKYLMIAGMVVLLVIYGYKGACFVYDSIKVMSHPAYQIAVLDMQSLRKEFNTQNPVSSSGLSKNNFEKYFKALMKEYRDRGYLVIDASLAVTIPSNVEFVSYIDLGESIDEVQSLQNSSKENEVR